MIREEYCSEEIARKLQRSDYPLEAVFIQDGRRYFFAEPVDHPDWCDCDAFYLPTLAQVMKWMREEHDVSVNIDGHGVNEYYADGRVAERTSTYRYDVQVLHMRTFTGIYQAENFKTYEDAAKAGINEALNTWI